jgi:hypothetical protein
MSHMRELREFDFDVFLFVLRERVVCCCKNILFIVCLIQLMFIVSATGQCCCSILVSHIPAGPWCPEAESPKLLMA